MGFPVATPVRGSAYKLSRRPKSRGLGLASWHDFPALLCGVPDLWLFLNVPDATISGLTAWMREWRRSRGSIVIMYARSVVVSSSLAEVSVVAMHPMQICFALRCLTFLTSDQT
jgi:hypothetical protein